MNRGVAVVVSIWRDMFTKADHSVRALGRTPELLVGPVLLISGTEFSDELEDIAGNPENVFTVDNFDALEGEEVEGGTRYPGRLNYRLLPAITQQKKAEPRASCIYFVVARISSTHLILGRPAIGLGDEPLRPHSRFSVPILLH